MTLTIERDGPVATLIRDRRAARNAMDRASAALAARKSRSVRNSQ